MPADESHGRIRITPGMLSDLGYHHLTRSEVTDLLDEIYDTLELRVGTRLAEGLDRNQLAHFERAAASTDELRAGRWLAENVPDYRERVRAEFDYIIGTLREANASAIKATGSRAQEPRSSDRGEGAL